jgi:hypothetical protein
MRSTASANGDTVDVGGSGADGGFYATIPVKNDAGHATGTDAMARSDARPVEATDAAFADVQSFRGFDAAESPPYPDDAAYNPTAPDGTVKGGGDSTVCRQQLAWWLTSAALDTSIVSATVAGSLGPLLSAQHALTLADFGDGGSPTSLVISGTETNGVLQQYFPYQYPTTPAALVISSDSPPVLTATSPVAQPSSGWIRLVDSSQAEVWIAMTNISVSVTAGDTLCQTLSNGRLSAIVPASAGSTSLVVGGSRSTVAELFGATDAASPSGWSLAMTFSASKTQVTLK